MYAVAGRDLLLVRLLHALLGVGTVALTARLGQRVFDARTGLVAGLLAATFLPAVFSEGEIEKTGLAVFLVTLGLFLVARAALDTAVTLNPQNAEAWMQLGKVHHAADRLDEAHAAYARAVAANPALVEAAFDLATIAQRQGRFADAVAIYRRLLATRPDDGGIHHNLAVALLGAGDAEEARRMG